jgi:hypothetical protein
MTKINLDTFETFESILKEGINSKDYHGWDMYIQTKKTFCSLEEIPREFSKLKKFVWNVDVRFKNAGLDIPNYGGKR